jgi:hypothetical protein
MVTFGIFMAHFCILMVTFEVAANQGSPLIKFYIEQPMTDGH